MQGTEAAQFLASVDSGQLGYDSACNSAAHQ